MKKFTPFLISLLLIALSSVFVYSQSDNTKLTDKTRKPAFNGNRSPEIQYAKYDKVPSANHKITSGINGLTAYTYIAYGGGGTGGIPKGPSSFDLDEPGTITSLGPGLAGNFMSAGTWADGKWYVVEYYVGNLYEINPFDGSMTYIGSNGYDLGGIAWDGTTMYACTGNYFGSISLEDASATLIGPMGNTGYMIGLGCDNSGNIYGVDIYEDNLYSINKSTGAATIIGPLGINLNEYAQDMDYDKDNNILYLAAYVDNDGALYTINTSTGAATFVGDFENGAEVDAFAIPYGAIITTNDIGIVSVSSPSSGTFLTDEEPVVVLINNFGTAAQSNFDVSFTVDDSTTVTETITDTINGGETFEYTFAATVDLSVLGEYNVEACTDLAGDENPENDCMTKTVVNSGNDYCDAFTLYIREYISFVLCGSINNTSFWQVGVGDFTDISTTIEPGMSEDISIINGSPHDNDAATAWVDWNNDTVFQQNSEEEFILSNDGSNEFFSGSIEVPAGTANGTYRMRVRLVRNGNPHPCSQSYYGEIEDYTIVVDNATNIDNNPINHTQIYPNPASNIVNIKSDNLLEYLTVFNQKGQKVFYMEMHSSFYQLNTSNFNSGIYLFLIKTDEGTVSRRIIFK